MGVNDVKMSDEDLPPVETQHLRVPNTLELTPEELPRGRQKQRTAVNPPPPNRNPNRGAQREPAQKTP